MKKYTINGLDCANCANEIECELKKVPGLEKSRLSFATSTLYIEELYETQARETIDGIEPRVTISCAENGGVQKDNQAEGPFDTKRVIRIGLAFCLFIIGIIFNSSLHASPYAIEEYAVLLGAYLLVGWSVLASALKNIMRGQVFNEMFLMSVATIGAILIHQLPEAVGVMLFYAVGEYFQDLAVERSRKSISGLMDLRPDTVSVFNGDNRIKLRPEEVSVGSLIEVMPGERIPLDGKVIEGSSFVNTSSLTGESVPRKVEPGSKVLGGFVNDEGHLIIRSEKKYGQTTAARILELVETASSQKAPTEKFITRFASVYTPIVVLVAALIAILPPLLIPGATFTDWLYRALVILVISCPCALVISIPLGYFGGIGGASRNRLLIKGGNYIDALTKVDTLVVDKTGTLTEGSFTVVSVATRNGFSKDEILRWSASAESHSTHPIARSIRETAPDYEVANDVSEIKGHGVIANVSGHQIIIGNDRLMHRENIAHSDCETAGTVVFVAVDGKYAGHLVIADKIKPNAAKTVAMLKKLGVRKIVMLTGDDEAVARRVADEIGIDAFRAELLPDGKVNALDALERDPDRRGALVFVGDGMNDAPVLMKADVGIAMGGLGSDAAIEAADVVIMDDHIERIPYAIKISRFTRSIVMQNIILALSVKGIFIVLGSLGVANMWEAVIGDVGVSLLAVMNAVRTARYARRSQDVN